MLGIIGAMDVEINQIKSKVQNKKSTEISKIEFITGTLGCSQVCVAKCNAGKVNASLCAQIMIDLFKVDGIINVGVGCSLADDVIIKNVVIATDVCEYDIDITALGEPAGFINGLNTVKVKTDEKLSNALARAAVNCGEKIHLGTVASGDTFIANDDMKHEIADKFGAICGEMEGGAIGHTCACSGVGFAVLRCISDGGDENSLMDYPTFKKIAADISTAIILEYLKECGV